MKCGSGVIGATKNLRSWGARVPNFGASEAASPDKAPSGLLSQQGGGHQRTTVSECTNIACTISGRQRKNLHQLLKGVLTKRTIGNFPNIISGQGGKKAKNCERTEDLNLYASSWHQRNHVFKLRDWRSRFELRKNMGLSPHHELRRRLKAPHGLVKCRFLRRAPI